MLGWPTLVLAAAASVVAAPANHIRALPPTQKLYAHADVVSVANGIQVHFDFTGRTDGNGTYVKVVGLKGLTNNPALGGPEFSYHIHTNPIPADGNCSKALAHLDPLVVTESLICNPAFPAYCQEGDLSGKHGKLKATEDGSIEPFGYTDNYLRFFPPDLSILGRSIVIHAANKTRIACGNIISTLDGTSDAFQNPSGKNSTYVKNYPTQAPPNPPQTLTFPGDSPQPNLPFPLANKALSLEEAVNVRIDVVDTQSLVNGTQVTTQLPKETKVEDAPPFQGVTDIY